MLRNRHKGLLVVCVEVSCDMLNRYAGCFFYGTKAHNDWHRLLSSPYGCGREFFVFLMHFLLGFTFDS